MRTPFLFGLLVSLSLPCLAGETAMQKGLFKYQVPAGFVRAPKSEQKGEQCYVAMEIHGYRPNVIVRTSPAPKGYSLKAIGDAMTEAWQGGTDKNITFAKGGIQKRNGNDVYLIMCMYRVETKQLTAQFHAFLLKKGKIVSISFGALADGGQEQGKSFLKSLDTFRWL